MKVLILFILAISQAFAADLSPVVDPNKFTVCAITINSPDEKKVFANEMAKHPGKFNPIVELTEMGSKDNWFDNACKSGVRCDQLVISGHFGGEFFSHESDLTLPMEQIEKAGCAKTCTNVLSNPYEIFLFGCNTLAGKEGDSRTREQYVQVLLRDHIPLARAEMVAEARYGAAGDSNKASMQRGFAGEKKQIYGFDSIGPSGESVKGFLRNYFAKSSPVKRLEKLQAQRMMDKVDFGNEVLAKSLEKTAFAQCEGVDDANPFNQNICKLLDEKLSVDKKLDLITELMAQENYLTYLPSILRFFDAHDPSGFTEQQKKSLAIISDNKVIKEQIMSLIAKTNSLGLKDQWATFANKMGFIDTEKKDQIVKAALIKKFEKPMTEADAEVLCAMKTKLPLKVADIKNGHLNGFDILGLECVMSESDPGVMKLVMNTFTATRNKDTLYSAFDYMANNFDPENDSPKPVIDKLRMLLASKDSLSSESALSLMAKMAPKDKAFLAELDRKLFSKSTEAVKSALLAYYELASDKKEDHLKILRVLKTTASPEVRGSAFDAIRASDAREPEVIVELERLSKTLPPTGDLKKAIDIYLKPVGTNP